MTTEMPQTEQEIDEQHLDQVEQPRSIISQIVIAVVFFTLGFVVALFFSQVNGTNSVADNQQMIDEIVAGVVNGLPETIAVAQADNAPAQPQPSAPNPNARQEVSADDDPFLGAEDAPILMVEFSDYRCPYCGRFATTTLEPLLEQYGDQLRFVYRDFPVLGNASVEAALASECADDQGEFWSFHDLMFANQQSLSRDAYLDFAQQLELDTDTFQTCLDEATHSDEVNADFEAAQASGASGTPAFFINGRFVSGAQPINVFTSIIDEELAAIEAQN